MRELTTQGVLDMLAGYTASAAVGTALELGLCHAFAEHPQPAERIAADLGIPLKRCRRWLDYLVALELLELRDGNYALTAAAEAAVTDVYSRDTWALLAQEARERYPAGLDLVRNIRLPGSVWDAIGAPHPPYVAQMIADSERARRFTFMLYEIHQPLAKELAATLDLRDVRRLLDLGGGSGVVSLALLERFSHLEAVVVDIANVCIAGRQIAARTGLADRITYTAADFLTEDLPAGFDMVLECDVGVYTAGLFEKLRRSLNPAGRFVLVDWFVSLHSLASPERLGRAFWNSLADPDFAPPDAADVMQMLAHARFSIERIWTLSGGRTVIESKVA